MDPRQMRMLIGIVDKPAIAQLVKHLIVESRSYQMVPGSIPGGWTLLEEDWGGDVAKNRKNATPSNGRGHGTKAYTWPGSNWRPSVSEADIIATRPQVLDSISRRLCNATLRRRRLCVRRVPTQHTRADQRDFTVQEPDGYGA